MIKYYVLLLCILMVASSAFAQATKPETTAADAPKLVSFALDDEKLSKATDEICKQVGVRILLEKTAEVKITAHVTEVPVEEALSVICKVGDLAWRRIYIKSNSSLLKNPDALAATLRLMEGLKFPDMIIEKTAASENLVHVATKPAVEAVPIALRKEMGMIPLYLITNDKAAKKLDEKAESNVSKYNQLQQQSIDLFTRMSPEEREQTMLSSLQFMQQMDPNYMALATRSVMKDPTLAAQAMQSWMQTLATMSPEERQAIDSIFAQIQESSTQKQQ